MTRRKKILRLSVLFSMTLHAALFAVAPKLNMHHRKADPETLLKKFKITLRADIPPEIPKAARAQKAQGPRPGSIRELLDREFEELPAPLSDSAQTAIPNLAGRLASDPIARDYDLEAEAAPLQLAEVKILEISQQAARDNVKIARRLVRPSPGRVAQEGELLGFGRHLVKPETVPLPLDNPTPSLLTQGVAPPAPPPSPAPNQIKTAEPAEPAPARPIQKPRYEDNVVDFVALGPQLPELPAEEIVARAPIIEQREEAREQSAYVFIDDLVDIDVDVFTPPGPEPGFFRLRIVPKADSSIETLPKDVAFVIDASNSISPRKLTVTARGVGSAINMLRSVDHFNVIVFRESPRYFRPGHVPATEANKKAAIDYLKGIESRGATDVYRAILPVVRVAPRAGVPGIVFVISDGRPTTGLRDSRSIINGLSADNKLRNSIYAFGGGNTVNRQLLDLLAYRNKGAAYVARRIEDIDEELPKFFKKLQDPLLVKLNADYGRIDEAEIYPKEISDFYRGQALTVYGRFDPASDKELVMRLSGVAQQRKKELIFRKDLAQAAAGDASIARNWAFQKSYHLIGEISRLGESPELLQQLRALANRYNIRTSYNE